jgi:RING-variant domain
MENICRICFTSNETDHNPLLRPCRICFTSHETDDNPLLRPCSCNSHVHRICLKKWNENRESDQSICEICHEKYAVAAVRNVNYKDCRKDICTVILYNLYGIFSLAYYVFAIPFAMFGYSLVPVPSYQAVPPSIIVPICFLIGYTGFFLDHCFFSLDSPKPDSKKKNFLNYLIILNIISTSVIVIQALSLFIANPILGNPIAFTPTGITFAVMLGLIAGLAILALIAYGIGICCRNYASEHWVDSKEQIVNKE